MEKIEDRFHAQNLRSFLGLHKKKKNIGRHFVNRSCKNIVEDDFTRYDLLRCSEQKKMRVFYQGHFVLDCIQFQFKRYFRKFVIAYNL